MEQEKILDTKVKIKERYDNLDIMKTIAIFMVIFLHIFLYEFNLSKDIESIRYYLSFFVRIICEGVPIFIVVNGFLIINKELSMKKWLKKILNIFVLLIIWNFITIICVRYIKGQDLLFKKVIDQVFNNNVSKPHTGHLWFLENLIMLYLFFPILKVCHDNNRKIYNYFFAIVSILVIGLPLARYILLITDKFFGVDILKYFNLFTNKYNFIANSSFIFYFMLGGYLFEKREFFENKENRIKAFLIGLIGYIISFLFAILIVKYTGFTINGGFNNNSIFMVGIIIGIFGITYKCVTKRSLLTRLVLDIGKNTLGIYLIHNILVAVSDTYIIFEKTFENTFLMSIAILLVSYILVKIIKKIPVIKKILEI